jgi:hypothetical protein
MKNFTLSMLLGIATTTTGIMLAATPAKAVLLTGTLPNANAISPTINFTSTGTVNFKTTSVAAGGFSPVVTIFNNDANRTYYTGPNDLTAASNADLNRTVNLAAGNYLAVVSAFGTYFDYPFKTIFSQGFDGSGSFGINRTGAYALDITSPTATAVPEPFTIVGTLLGGTAALRLRKRLKSNNKM